METLVKEQITKLVKDKLVIPDNIENLNKVIELKNKLTKQLNNLYSKVESITNILNPIENIIPKAKTGIQIAQTAINAISFIPSTAVTPIPVGPILQAQKAINFLRTLLGRGEGKITEGTSSITLLLDKLQTVIDLLEIVDIAINTSAEELGGDLNEQEQISQELLKSTQQQSQQLSPTISNVNGFDMGVITLSNKVGKNLNRRQAVAKNSQGIIMLRGEPSFSSNDQILIDQLVFYIQQNNLNANGFNSSESIPLETPNNTSLSTPTNLSSVSSTTTVSSRGGGGGGSY
jgi:hypothetical protein